MIETRTIGVHNGLDIASECLLHSPFPLETCDGHTFDKLLNPIEKF